MRDWELVDSDRFSFDDSDRFEEDSLCSWVSEPESLCNNWRGWKKSNFNTPNANNGSPSGGFQNNGGASFSSLCIGGKKSSLPDFSVASVSSAPGLGQLNLVEMAAKCVASHIPFEMVERFYLPVPEQLQLRIAFWSFPEHEEDIRLYSCLANGSAEEFQKGEKLFKSESVSDILQIGFHLSATVKPNVRESHKVAVTFDRRRVTSCTCTCNSATNWCGHVVAVCLHRIFQSKDVTLRAPVSESLSRLHRDQLQKFAQYLISELPQQILPTAQRLLDELLSSQRSAINTLRGAPDPTAGSSANEQTTWYLDEKTLHGNIHKILIKFCVPAPIVFSDVNYLSSAAPPASAEWSSLLRPLRGREPEGMWNLLSIVREMFRREDRNAIPLLEIITEECLNCDQILVWWFNTKVALHNGNAGHGGKHHSVNSNAHACQHAGSSLCDEIVLLWRLAALNPGLSPDERCILHNQFKEWHLKIIEKISKSRSASVGSKHASSYKNDVEIFPGFRPSLEACYLNWENYPIPGITYSESSKIYHCPFMCFRHSDGHSRSGETGLIHSSHAILNNPAGEHHLLHSSATIAAPMMIISKRPRSVDFGVERESTSSKMSNSASAAGPSKPGKTSRSSKKRHDASADSLNEKPCTSSSVKVKSKDLTSENEQTMRDLIDSKVVAGPSRASYSGGRITSEKDDLAIASSSSSSSIQPRRPKSIQRQPSDGNRSSVSSEGFCENENELEPDNCDKDEGVEIGESSGIKSNVISTSDDFDPEDGDNDIDSDSSVSVRIPGQSIPKLPISIARKSDSSDSQPSDGDEYQLYYYDPKMSSASESGSGGKRCELDEGSTSKKDTPGSSVLTNLRKIDDEWEILFARAEGLHSHGHSKEACKLGVQLAQELLANPPDLSLDSPTVTTGKGKRKRVNPASHQVSCLASVTLAKCGFLCTVLAENPEYFCLAFRIGMFGLELARPPASTKPLEVKLANQEAELALLLKKIPIGQKELDMIREKAEALRQGNYKSRGDALLPLVLANFIFDALVMPNNREGRCSLQSGIIHQASDESLGFEAAVAALGLKANVSEAEHPLLCEGTRRQRGDLVLSILLHYKDDQDKLAKIMDKLLDREIHQLYKSSLPMAYYSNNPPTTTLLSNLSRNEEATRETTGNAQLVVTSATNASNIPSNSSETAKTVSASDIATEMKLKAQNSLGSDIDTGLGTGITGNLSGNSPPTLNTTSGSIRHGKDSGRFKGKRSYPVLPNQPSEAGAHFMFELAKVVLGKAGGSSNQSLFTQPSNGQNPRGPHRALHMCAFHIGLYALGLHNAVSPNWLSRTYSSHVSWITGQAMEIGAPAIAFLIDTWESHLTPTESVTIADRASRGDANMVKAAAELALSCLPHAHALNPNELHRAILQCKEQSDGMLEKACTTVESAAKGGGVYPEVLFDVAKQWFSLYQKHLPHVEVDLFNEDCSHHDSFLIIDSGLDPLSHNHHQIISAQTGMPPVNSSSPPSLPPTSSNSGPCLSHESVQISHIGTQQITHQAIYPLGTPQMNSIPYACGPPFLPAAFNPIPLTMYPQAILYESNGSGNSAGPNSTATYYNQHNHQNQQSPGQFNQGMHQFQPISHSHHHHSSSLMSAGASLQYYSPIPNAIQVPITSAGGPSYRPGPQFFPISHINLHNNHSMNNFNAGQSGNGQSSHSHVSAVVSATGVGMSGHPSGHHGGHLVGIPTGNMPPSGQPMMLRSSVSGGASSSHGMERSRGSLQTQDQMNCNNSLMNHVHHHMVVGNHQIGPHFNGMQMNDGGPNSSPNGRDSLNSQQPNSHSSIKAKYLMAAYRVGMLAMETLARRVHDDRPAAKFARNPPYGEDVKWLLMISRKLGAQYVQQFCICAVSSIANPFVLHEIILDASFINNSRASLAWIYQNPRSPLAPLVQKCQQMYFQCLHQKLYHITLSEYEDFVSIVCMARQAFHLTGDGSSQFKEWLQNLRRSKACKKDLWAQITTALQNNPK